MRFPIWLTVIAAMIGLGIVLIIGTMLLRPPLPLIVSAGFDRNTITPNADGDSDLARFSYELSRSARVSIVLENEQGDLFYFRKDGPRSARDYAVLFSGVVDGYVLPGEALALDIDDDPDGILVERRLLPDGVYTWRLIAESDNERDEASGTLTIENSDSPLPIMTTFTLSTDVFSPNRDGVNDRVIINIFVEKEADLRVFLIDDKQIERPIAQREQWSRPDGEAGRYTYDYEGGVDLNLDPPPDGTYTVVAIAQDDEGQRVRREARLSIERGGVPLAEIEPQAVDADVLWTTLPYDEAYANDSQQSGEVIDLPPVPDYVSAPQIAIRRGDLLVFQLTVNNYSDVPIRTTAPMPGTVYLQNQQPAAFDALEEPGAWRVGIMCDTSETSFPYRWAIGTDDDLITISDPETGREYRYLPSGAQAVVWGAIRMSDVNPSANPQTCWAGLIHEQVGISVENRFVGPIEVLISDTVSSNTSD